MKRLICWWHGRDYVFGVVRKADAVVRGSGPAYDAVICLRCEVHSLRDLSVTK